MHSICLTIALLLQVQARTPAADLSWRQVPDAPEQIALYRGDEQVGCYSFESCVYRPYNAKTKEWGKASDWVPIPAPKGYHALMMVNTLRQRAGLRHYIYDEKLAEGALAVATYRAMHRIEGHVNDFAFLPAGAQSNCAGCAAWPQGMGFGACEVYGGHTYCGAAWVIGPDGIRYCHAFYR
jgi:hypothetical protein